MAKKQRVDKRAKKPTKSALLKKAKKRAVLVSKTAHAASTRTEVKKVGRPRSRPRASELDKAVLDEVRKARKAQPTKACNARTTKATDAGEAVVRDSNGQFVKGNPFRYDKGESGNPLGRIPTTRQLTSIMGAWLERPASCLPAFSEMALAHGLNPDEVQVQDVLMLNHLFHVQQGNGRYMQEMFDRIEGKVIERVATEISGKMGVNEFMDSIGARTRSHKQADDEDEDDGGR